MIEMLFIAHHDCFFYIVESSNYDVFVAEIGLLNPGRLFSLKFSRPSSIRAYLAPHDAILILYRDSMLSIN